MIEIERTTPSASTAAAAALENGFRGHVIRPGDAGYDETRAVWNASIDRRPALIARCTGAADVARAVSVAREHDLLVSVRGGGHNIAGLAVCDGGMMIDLSPMRGIHVDPAARTARAQPGTVWADFDHETQAFGLATPGGLISSTGIAGFTLGGGFGWLSRRHGLACDTMLSADVVTAGGSHVTASATENPDLFWGLRGGGGNFGIVTSFEYRLVEVGPTVLAGLVVHPLERAAAVLRELSEQLVNAPREAMFAAILRLAPPAPFLPPEVHGKHVMMLAMIHTGPLDDADRVLGPARRVGDPIVDLVAPQPYVTFQAFSDRSWLKGMQNYWKAEYLNVLDAPSIDAIVDHAARITSPLSDIKLGALGGGAIADVADGDSAYSYRRAPYILNINSRWEDAADADRHIEWTRSLWSAVHPHSYGGVYVNFLGDEGQDRVRAAYGDAVYDRLSVLKSRYDPDNFFRVNQNIRPANTA